MSHFNLIDEKWIPVRFTDGSRGELGIRETLLRSKEIAVVEDDSPLVVGFECSDCRSPRAWG